MNFIKKYLILTLSFAGPLTIYGGTVKKILRLDIYGKKVIFFGEKHKGIVNPEFPLALQNQFDPLKRLVEENIKKVNPSFYIEANSTYSNQLKKYQQENNVTTIFGQPISYFDFFHTLYCQGVRSIEHHPLDSFDERTALDVKLMFAEIEFIKILNVFFDSQCDLNYLANAKKEFFESDEYANFQDIADEWFSNIVDRLEQEINTTKMVLPQEFKNVADRLVQKRIKYLGSFINIKQKADFMQKSFFEFLFYILETVKSEQEWLQVLESFFSCKLPAFYHLFDCLHLFVELPLLKKIVNDPKPTIIVYGGTEHCQMIYKIITESEDVSFIDHANILELINTSMVNDQSYCYQQMHNFIFSDLE